MTRRRGSERQKAKNKHLPLPVAAATLRERTLNEVKRLILRQIKKKLSYHRGTARRPISVETLSTAARMLPFEKGLQYLNDLESRSRLLESPLFDRSYITSY